MTTHSGDLTGAKNPPRSLSWRVVDIVIAAVLAVAVGLLFLFWNFAGYAWFKVMEALTPGLGGLATGGWLIGGVVGALVIRKPGAAIFVETLAACVSMALGSQWGVGTLYSGLAQGIGAELIFLAFAYRHFGLKVSLLAGAAAGVGAWVLELFTSGNLAMSTEFLVIYLVCLIISGAILAGLVGYIVVQALARTGALDRFAVGREARALAH
ncbi:ECF transporter S component [Corynebacterium lizhenjunii]|uniref:ECF transporter S component n=1 Tax=Corynebacterium lizhenjunii TaxID=2709394 RepID=A0A7T0KGU7_9CORY|nr:ECF transporter S component [Corynebacterium lizhenjunii]QPK79518.1 ECF transporter S component [Corynebacterium lizhenjunii]